MEWNGVERSGADRSGVECHGASCYIIGTLQRNEVAIVV